MEDLVGFDSLHPGVAKESRFVRLGMRFFSFSFRSLPIWKLHLYFDFSGVRDSLLFQLPITKGLPFEIKIVVSAVVQLLSLFIMAHISRDVFLLLMDELTQAVTQFYPTSGGGFNLPPTPPSLPPTSLSPFLVEEGSQNDPFDVLSAEEKQKDQELRNSKEWRETERHLLKIENKKKEIGQRAKEIAQAKGWNPECCEGVELAAEFIAEDVEDIPEQWQLNFLANLMRDLKNPNSESWKRIKLEAKKWRPWDWEDFFWEPLTKENSSI